MTIDTHTLSGAYALDALEPSEVEAFERHLDECAACRHEVEEFRVVAAELAAAESSAPSPALRQRVLDEAARTRQLSPLVTELPVGPARVRRATRWLGAAAAALVIAVGGGVAINQAGHDGSAPMAASVSQVFSASDAQVHEVETANGGILRIAKSPSLNEVAMDASKLPKLSDRQVYQLWTVRGGTARSAGLLGSTGAAMPIPEGAEVAITIEAAGGATQPTRDPIVSLDPTEI